MRINMQEVAGSEILAGAMRGRQVLGGLVSAIVEPEQPEACFIDFLDVEIATASFLRESVLEYRRIVRGKRSTIYPVIANASEEILDDLALVLRFRGDAMLACELARSGKPTGIRIIGELEALQRETFSLVVKHGEVDVATLKRSYRGERSVGITAWNNRISALVAKGLVMEHSTGRAKAYRPVIGGR